MNKNDISPPTRRKAAPQRLAKSWAGMGEKEMGLKLAAVAQATNPDLSGVEEIISEVNLSKMIIRDYGVTFVGGQFRLSLECEPPKTKKALYKISLKLRDKAKKIDTQIARDTLCSLIDVWVDVLKI